jgi:hypothetical protein
LELTHGAKQIGGGRVVERGMTEQYNVLMFNMAAVTLGALQYMGVEHFFTKLLIDE